MNAEVRHSLREPALIRGARVARPRAGRVEEADVFLADGRVGAVAPRLSVPPGVATVDGRGLWLLPGWIDLQVNDLGWLAGGPRRAEEHTARVREVAAHLVRGGVTGFILATLAAPLDEVISYLEGMRAALDDLGSPAGGAFLGGLVEGTFMNPECCGAHNPAWVLRPEPRVVGRILDTGAARMINIAPETSTEAIDCVRLAASRGAIVAAGHAKPHAERLREAVDAGLRYAIHLGNGPTGSSLKAFHDGGMLQEVLRDDRVVAGIIFDGIDVHPRLARDWIARKEFPRVILVSDAAFATGAPPGEFEVLGVRGVRSPDGRWLAVVRPAEANPLSSDAATLFGSAASMRDVFANAASLLSVEMEGVCCRRHAALPVDAAILAACLMTSTNPADLLGLRDRGCIEPGSRADCVLARIHGDPGRLGVDVVATWID